MIRDCSCFLQFVPCKSNIETDRGLAHHIGKNGGPALSLVPPYDWKPNLG